MSKGEGLGVCVYKCVFPCSSVHVSASVCWGWISAVTAMSQPWSRGGEGDGEGRVSERRGESIGGKR